MWLMTKRAVGLRFINELPFFEHVIAHGPGLVGLDFGDGFVRAVNFWVEPAAVIVEKTHRPKGQRPRQDEQPDRRLSRAGGRLDFFRPARWIRFGVHFAGAFVVAAAGALVKTTGVATVIGVSKMTVSARRLSR